MINALSGSYLDNFVVQTVDNQEFIASNITNANGQKLIGRDKNGMFKNHKNFIQLRN